MPAQRRIGPGVTAEADSKTTTVSLESTVEPRCESCRRSAAPGPADRAHGPVCWTCRRAAAARLPLLDCGCADPWVCRCGTVAPLSDNQVDGYVDAARFIMDTTGCLPLLPLEVLRRLWSRGGEDRALAVKLRAATDGAVA